MTVYCSLQRNANFGVEPNEWHTVTGYDKVNKDTHGAYPGNSTDIIIPEDGVYLFSAKVTWGGHSSGQRLVRFIRDIGDMDDDTGTADKNTTPGYDYIIHNWPCYMTAGRRMALQIQQTSGVNIGVLMVQFKATRIA